MSDLRRLFDLVEAQKHEGYKMSAIYGQGYVDALNLVLDLIEDIETGALDEVRNTRSGETPTMQVFPVVQIGGTS